MIGNIRFQGAAEVNKLLALAAKAAIQAEKLKKDKHTRDPVEAAKMHCYLNAAVIDPEFAMYLASADLRVASESATLLYEAPSNCCTHQNDRKVTLKDVFTQPLVNGIDNTPSGIASFKPMAWVALNLFICALREKINNPWKHVGVAPALDFKQEKNYLWTALRLFELMLRQATEPYLKAEPEKADTVA